MRVTLVFFWSFIFTGAAIAASLNPSDGAILPADESKGLLHQCSRGAPQQVAGTWTPSGAQIRALESRLSAALAMEARQRGPRYSQPAIFRRQYAGVLIGGRRIVYVNAFPYEVGEPAGSGTPAARKFDWHRDPVVVCDGGPAFFGVEYDPEKQVFLHFEFNGPP
jgi:hypothetical protein